MILICSAQQGPNEALSQAESASFSNHKCYAIEHKLGINMLMKCSLTDNYLMADLCLKCLGKGESWLSFNDRKKRCNTH